MSIFEDDTPCYWITLCKRRIGGVCIEPNSLSSFFLVPPFIDVHHVLIKLKRFLLQCSDSTKQINAYGILPYQAEHFLRLGFLPSEARRVMIRPTELFELQEWGEELVVITPTPEQIEKIASCFLNHIQVLIASGIQEKIQLNNRNRHSNIISHITK